jgi:hypothetical protein
VALPELSAKQRAAALEKAAAARRARAELKDRLRRGGTNLHQVLKDAETDEVLGKMKVSALLEALPKVGKVKAQEIMTELEIAPTRRLRGLGDRQRKALLESFAGGAHTHARGHREDIQLGRQRAPQASSPAAHESSPPASGRPISHTPTPRLSWLAELDHRQRFDVYSTFPALAARLAAEVVKDGDDALVRLELPGVDADQDVIVEVENGAVTIRLRGAVSEQAVPAATPPIDHPSAIEAEEAAPVPMGLLGKLAAVTEAQLGILREIDAATKHSRRERVTLDTATGTLEYTLPLSLDETYSSAAVSKILSPTGKGHRSIAQHRRRAHELLGIKIGNQYRYPKFQINPARHEIRPIVAYANRRLECDADPWGTLDWWYSEDEALDDRRPIDMVESGELTEELVDFAIELSQQGMD